MFPSNLDFLRAAAARGIPFTQKVAWSTGSTPKLTVEPKANYVMFIDRIQCLPSSDFAPGGSDKIEIIGLTAEDIYYTGTAQGDGGGDDTIKLASTASDVDDIYNNLTIDIVDGIGKGQTKTITDYVGSTRIATVDSDWTTKPDSTSVYKIRGKIEFSDLDELKVGLNSFSKTDDQLIYVLRPPLKLDQTEMDSLIIQDSGGESATLTGTIKFAVFGWTIPADDF